MKTIVQVKMLVDTTFGGQRLHVGDILGVDEVVGQRWHKRKLAIILADTTASEPNFEELSAKQLYSLCIEKGIDVKPKLEKEEYIKLLSMEG